LQSERPFRSRTLLFQHRTDATYRCCPTGNTCSLLSNSLVGCCPTDTTCSGSVAANQVTTVTVYQQNTVTQYQQPTTVIAGGGGVYVYPTTTTPAATVNGGGIVYNGYCSTLYADGPGLPTTRAGQCGTILVVQAGADSNSARSFWLGMGIAGAWAFVGGFLALFAR